MKKISMSLLTLIALSSQSYAGGDLLPVEEYEAETIFVKIEPVVAIVKPVVVKELKPETVAPLVASLVDDSSWYAGVGLVAGRTKNENCEDITYGVMAKAGYNFNDYMGVEARGLITNWEYEGSKIKHLGAFLKPQYPVSEDFNLYGLAGYAKTTTSHIQNISETGFAYGAGVEYAVMNDMNMFVDYERLIEKSNIPDLDAVSLGVSFDF